MILNFGSETSSGPWYKSLPSSATTSCRIGGKGKREKRGREIEGGRGKGRRGEKREGAREKRAREKGGGEKGRRGKTKNKERARI